MPSVLPQWRTVVRVIPDVRAFDIQTSEPEWIEGTVYVPYNSTSTREDGAVPSQMTIAVRTSLDAPQWSRRCDESLAG